MSKRKIQETIPEDEIAVSTPSSKRSRKILEQNTPSKHTPTKTPTKQVKLVENDVTPRGKTAQQTPKSQRSKGKNAYSTPQKQVDPDGRNVYIVQNADRSARRRSARHLIEQTVTGEISDEEDLGGQSLAQEIFQEDANGVESGEDEDEPDVEPETPSKDKRKRRRKKSPTPPADLAPHERYFYDNRATAAKTSMNTLSTGDLISHSAYHEAITQTEDSHASSIEDLHAHHESLFPLWSFELSQQFSLCLYGYGSKSRILKSFAAYLHKQSPDQPPITIMAQGTHPDISLKSILGTLAATVLPSQQTKLPAQPQQLATVILDYLTDHPGHAPIYLFISAFHTKALTSTPSLAILSQLATQPGMHLVLTADNPSFPLLFPAQLRATFNFLFHDTTTFVPYDLGTAESEMSTVVDTVLELIGRKTSAAAGREGVRWVLRSLPENARGLYRVLVSEILSAAAEGSAPAFDTPAERPLGEDIDATPSKKRARKEAANHGLPGIDAKALYQKAVEEFLCSSEMMFWGLLKEFVDHRMVIVRKERGLTGGGEMLGVEIGKGELEGILEDLLE